MSESDPTLKQHPVHGYFYFDPPSDEFLREHYERKYFQENAIYSSDYSAQERDFFLASARRKIGIVARHLGTSLPAGFRCLELGVGEGWSLAALKAAGAQVQGVDYNNHGLAKWNPDLVDAVTLAAPESELEQLALSGEQFDLVWLDNVLEHVPRPEPFLEKVFRVLRPGGILLVEVPNDKSVLHDYLQGHGLIAREFWQAYPEHLSYFTRESLGSLVAAKGFAVQDVLADFPIDLFLLNDASNYVNNRDVGKAAHRARLRFEEMLAGLDPQAVVRFYRALGDLGLGRNMVALCVKKVAGD